MTVSELRSRLAQSRTDVVEFARSLSELAFEASPSSHWSVGEQLHHLYLTETIIGQALVRLEQKGIAKNLIVEEVAKEFNPRAEVIHVFDQGYNSIPAFTGTEPSPRIGRTTLLIMLDESRHACTNLLAKAECKDYRGLDFPHSYLGRLSFYEWLLFVAVHEEAHLRQMITDRRS